ncbi:C-_U-editing enzyme APOBEC-1-like isoform X2 [Prinia subflava]|uniref:C->U-editing enzyme APOBEC-1-like isoform X2 n=1 Tax=Prinia subflava TaxID=208062 RepID=UPI002FE1A0BC
MHGRRGRGLRGMYISRRALRSHFDPRKYPHETYLLCQLEWNGSGNDWIHWVRNDKKHAEVYFLEEIFEPRIYGFCTITLYLSYSPCWRCCSKIQDFLNRYPNVKIDIFVARLFYADDGKNCKGLKELSKLQRVTIQVMEVADYKHCLRIFIQSGVCYDFSPEDFETEIRRYRLMLKNILTTS